MKNKFLFPILMFYAISLFGINGGLSKENVKEKIANTGLLSDRDDQTLLVSTLDGTLHAVSKATGEKKWTLKDSPIIQNPDSTDQSAVPRFFPNPKDGSLYRYTFGRSGRDPLKKLPFTIPELVANSPCRSNDGIFYIGKKTDSWVGVDIFTGKKQFVLGMDSTEKVCPKPSRNTVYIGRTLYNIMFYELHTGNKWNVSYYDYSRNSDFELEHDQTHFTATGEGGMLTFDVQSGVPLWGLDFGSPVVGIYLLTADNALASVPVTSVTPETLQRFTDQLKMMANMELPSEDLRKKEFRLTTYVGESENGVYALPALIDENTARISQRENHLLLDGPEGQRGVIPQPEIDIKDENDFIILGYYDSIDSSDVKLDDFGKTIEKQFVGDLPLGITHKDNGTFELPKNTDDAQHIINRGFDEVKNLNLSYMFSKEFVKFSSTAANCCYQWVFEAPINTVVTFLIITLILGFIYFRQQTLYLAALSSSRNAVVSSSSRGSNSGRGDGEITAVIEELDTGETKVGKITFDPRQRLGTGCQGTFVYNGTFDGRQIAVKRVLPSCFSVADREVDLLRASDQHENVVRYYCMEQCREFKYIALELCAATLDDLVSGRFFCQVPNLTLLQEATAGLNHLHSLDIVHRDIKPQNVLLSLPNAAGKTRAMISDFGLCKKLEVGHNSFSKRSGITGTDGWIAPEMINQSHLRPTTKVDIFSLGCVYYYVLSKGKHPFGFLIDRQSNIINNKANLSHLDDDVDVLPKTLIENMVKNLPSERPPCSAVLSHPLLWSPDRILQFFQDVSDRVEKESSNSFVMRKLESGAIEVVRDDWTKKIHPTIGEDLRRFRDYNGRSVRDLLRALRNKKNHYRELTEQTRQIFGRIPEDFVLYWTQLFPRLLLHSWYAMQYCKSEPIFAKYFSSFSFVVDKRHQTISLSPNNRRTNFNEFPDPNTSFLTKKRQHKKKRDPYDFLDVALGPQTNKGPRKPPKHESDSYVSPAWILRKPSNTFEPDFVYESPTNKSPQKSLEQPQHNVIDEQPED